MFYLKEGVLWYKERLRMPDVLELKKEAMKEAHNSTFTAYPGSTKMYDNSKTYF